MRWWSTTRDAGDERSATASVRLEREVLGLIAEGMRSPTISPPAAYFPRNCPKCTGATSGAKLGLPNSGGRN